MINKATLGEVIDGYKRGTYTETEVDRYLALWNATPGRFTVARRIGQNIMQFDKE
jgi:hypothetical protein